MSNTIKVMAVDDHPLIIKGYELSFSFDRNIELIATAVSVEQMFQILKNGIEPHIILLDIKTRKGEYGSDALIHLKKEYPNIQAIIISSYFTDMLVVKCFKNGASAYLDKSEDFSGINEIVREVREKGFYHSEKVNLILKDSHLTENILTSKEIEILKLICTGKMSKEIAHVLDKKKETITFHKKNIFRKTGCMNDAQLGIYARAHCLIDN